MTTSKPAWLCLARDALVHATLGDNDAAGRVVQQIANTYGPTVVPKLICAWVDHFVNVTRIDPDRIAGIVFQEETSTEITTADEVPAPVAWAGRLFIARVKLDQAQFEALYNSVPDDEFFSAGVSSTLLMVAANLRRVGYDRLLRTHGYGGTP